MKIAAWNVNSVRSRLDRTLSWLQRNEPDALCLQEVKVETAKFPLEPFQETGYNVAVHGQKTYNGVAIVSPHPIEDVQCGFGDGDPEDPQARLVGGTIKGVRVFSAYIPNGSSVTSDKWTYKLSWLDRLAGCLGEWLKGHPRLALCGDFNISRDDRDVHDPEAWEGTVLYNDEVRTRMEGLLDAGLIDTFRQHCDEGGLYSWWDYRQLAFPKNRGLRIDYVLASNELASHCTHAFIDRNERKGKQPSDHAPVVAEFEL